MDFKDAIHKIRKELNMTQEQFAEEFKVSKQAVQKWENGTSYPEISKIIEISKRFDISLDSILLNRDMRDQEERYNRNTIIPNYAAVHYWELYGASIMSEYTQCIDEGLDMETGITQNPYVWRWKQPLIQIVMVQRLVQF